MSRLYQAVPVMVIVLLAQLTAAAQIDPRLLAAIRQNDPRAVETILRTGVNPNATDSLGATALMWACYQADTAVVQVLVKAGAKTKCRGVIRTDTSTYYGNLTGLAAGLNKLPLLRYLLETLKLPVNEPEYNPETKKYNGWTPAEWAAANGHLAVLTFLADHGADLHVGKGNPMVFAIGKRQTDVVGLLLERGMILDKANPTYQQVLESYFKQLLDLASAYQQRSLHRLAAISYEQVCVIYGETVSKQDKAYATFLNNLASAYQDMSQHEKALLLYLEAKGIYEKAVHKTYPDYLICLNNLASLYRVMGQQEKALPILLEVKEIREKVSGKSYPDYMVSLNNLAGLYRAMYEFQKALPLYFEAKNIAEKARGKNHIDYGISLNNLAELYRAMGEYQKSLPLYLEAKDIAEKTPGKNHPGYGASLINLAELYLAMGEYEKALPLYLEAKDIAEKARGKNHLDYGASLNSLAELYRAKGEYEKALTLYLEAKDIFENVLGRNHLGYATPISSLAELYRTMGEYQKSLLLYLEAKEITEKALGKNHPGYGASLNNLAGLYQTMGEFEKALPLYLEAKVIFEKAMGKNHPDYSALLAGLAGLYQAMGEYGNALPLYLESTSITERALDKNHPGYGGALSSLAGLYQAMGEYEKAFPLFLEAKSIAEKALGKNHLDYGTSLARLAGLYLVLGAYEKALPLYLESKAIAEKALGKNHLLYGRALASLAGLYQAMGEYEKAFPLFLEAKSIAEKALGTTHPDYGEVLANLAGLYQAMGEYENAHPLYVEAKSIAQKALGKNHPGYGAALASLAGLYQTMAEYEKAFPLFLEAKSIAEKALGKNHLGYGAALANLAGLYQTMGEYEKAFPLFLEAKSIAEKAQGKNHPDYAASLHNLAGLYLVKREYEKALPLYLESKAITEKALGKNHPTYAQSLNNLALLYELTSQYDKAISLRIEARQQYRTQIVNQIGIMNETTIRQFQNQFDRKESVYSLGYLAQSQALAGQHYNDALFSSGVGLMASQQINRLLDQTSDILAQQIGSQLRNTKLYLNRMYALPRLQQRGVDSLQRQANVLEQQLLLRLPEYAQVFNPLRVEWPQVQQNLKPDEATIEFVSFNYFHNLRVDSTLYIALVLRPGYTQPKYVFLGEQRQLDTLLTTATASPAEINGLYRGGKLQNGGNSSQLERGKALTRFIWQPLDSLLQGVNTVYVAPSGRLHQVALAALPNPADTSLRTRMADRFQIRQVGSTRVVALRKKQPEHPLPIKTLNTVLYGGITYDTDSLGLIRQAHRDAVEQRLAFREATRSGEWSYLRGTQVEVDNLRRLLPPTQTLYVTKEGATEPSVKALSGKSPTILHIATHGFFFPDLKLTQSEGLDLERQRNQFEIAENPLLRSGLVMAGANYVWKGGKPIEGVDDGILTAYEVSNLNLKNTELVVLSACETALGQVRGSEGVYGLQRAFKMAGVKYLLMSLWRVSDKETAEYMTYFYEKLLKTSSVPQAYTYAQSQMRTQYPQEPFKWAAFVLIE